MKGKKMWVVGAIVLGLAAVGTVAAQVSSSADSAVELVQDWAVESGQRIVAAIDRIFHRGDREEPSARRASAQSQEFEWSGAIAAGDLIEIRGVNGSIVAGATSGDEVRVTATKRARRSDPAEVVIEVIEHSRGVTVCAVYPSRGGEDENRCARGDGYHMNTNRNDVQVDFEVLVPAGVEFEAKTVNGSVEALGLDGDARISTVNGNVEVVTSGFAEANTVNGSIRASVEGEAFGGGVTFETVNGSIELDLPDDIDADLDTRWLNGGLESELPFHVEGTMTKTSATGRLGEGAPRLSLSTVNGSIRIR